MTSKKTLSPTRINTTSEFVSFLKEEAKVEKNWVDNKTTMRIRVALGARREEDPACVANDIQSMGELLPTEELFLQEQLDQPIKYFSGKATSKTVKSRPAAIERFLDHLYNNIDSQLYHGFTMEMKAVMRSTFICEREFYDNVIGNSINENYIPMDDIALSRLISYVTTTREFYHLHPEKNKFAPKDARRPPTMTQWKRTKEGKEHAELHNDKSGGRHGGRSTLADLLFSKIGGEEMRGATETSTTMTTPIANTDTRIGMIELNTGAETIKIGYSSKPLQGNDYNVLLNTSLRDIVVKSKQWLRYDKSKISLLIVFHSRIYITFNMLCLTLFRSLMYLPTLLLSAHYLFFLQLTSVSI